MSKKQSKMDSQANPIITHVVLPDDFKPDPAERLRVLEREAFIDSLHRSKTEEYLIDKTISASRKQKRKRLPSAQLVAYREFISTNPHNYDGYLKWCERGNLEPYSRGAFERAKNK